MHLRQNSADVTPRCATIRYLAVRTAPAEERGVTRSNSGQVGEGCGPNPAQEACNLRESDNTGMAFRNADTLQQGLVISRDWPEGSCMWWKGK